MFFLCINGLEERFAHLLKLWPVMVLDKGDDTWYHHFGHVANVLLLRTSNIFWDKVTRSRWWWTPINSLVKGYSQFKLLIFSVLNLVNILQVVLRNCANTDASYLKLRGYKMFSIYGRREGLSEKQSHSFGLIKWVGIFQVGIFRGNSPGKSLTHRPKYSHTICFSIDYDKKRIVF